jgi:hypothetical protein
LFVLCIVCAISIGSGSARADGRFSFGLSIWGPPPVFVGPPYAYGPYYPPPVVVRRVYVPTPVQPVYVRPSPVVVSPAPAPASSRHPKPIDLVLVKIGELHSDDDDVREDAAKWLGDSRDSRAVRPLIETLMHDRKDDVREEAARGLGQIGGPDAERALTISSTNDPDDDVRRTASKSLARLARQTSKRVRR